MAQPYTRRRLRPTDHRHFLLLTAPPTPSFSEKVEEKLTTTEQGLMSRSFAPANLTNL